MDKELTYSSLKFAGMAVLIIIFGFSIQIVISQSFNKTNQAVQDNGDFLKDSRQVNNDYRNLSLGYMKNISDGISVLINQTA